MSRIDVNVDGTFYYKDGYLHREDGPAIEYRKCSNEWLTYGSGSKEWLINGKHHREDGPAIERFDGSKEWLINGKHHREDGPAIERSDGSKRWFLNDIERDMCWNCFINPSKAIFEVDTDDEEIKLCDMCREPVKSAAKLC